jgi:hypothetical protein
VLSDIVIHYHIGIRHYSATEPARTVVCAGKNASALVNTAAEQSG